MFRLKDRVRSLILSSSRNCVDNEGKYVVIKYTGGRADIGPM